MKKKVCLAIGLWCAFLLWTVAVCLFDVAAIGPNGSAVGFATLNGWFHQLTGVHWTLYTITDWLSLVPVAVCLAFAVVGLCQWIRRKRLFKVDADILLLGIFYIVTIAFYLLFEFVVINYRPILIDGYLEASYPSSTTLLVWCVMSTAQMQLRRRIHRREIRKLLTIVITAFMAFMVLGRLLSGVHWLTDIVGGLLLGAGLVTVYDSVC